MSSDEAALHRVMLAVALLLLIGSIVSAVSIRNGVAAEEFDAVTE